MSQADVRKVGSPIYSSAGVEVKKPRHRYPRTAAEPFQAGDRIVVNRPGYIFDGKRGVVVERRAMLAVGADSIGPAVSVDLDIGPTKAGFWFTSDWLMFESAAASRQALRKPGE